MARDTPSLESCFAWLARASPDPALLLAPDGEILAAGVRAGELYRCPPAALAGRSLAELAAPGAGAQAARDLAEAWARGGGRFDARQRRDDGEVFEAALSLQVLDEPAPRGLVLVRHISARKLEEARYRELFESSPDSISLTSLEDGVLVAANPAFLRRHGLTAAEALGRRVETLPAFRGEEMREIGARARRDGEVRDLDLHVRGPGGAEAVVAFTGLQVEVAGARYLLGIGRDVTQERALARRLREREELLSRILELMQEPVWLLDAEGRTVFANERLARAFGLTPAEMIGRLHTDFTPPEAAEAAVQLRNLVMAGHEQRDEISFFTPGQPPRHLWRVITPFRQPDGRITGTLGVYTDMTDLQEARRELAAEKERLAVTLESIGDAVIATDAEGRVTLLNAAAEALTGWPAAEALGHPLEEVFRIVSEGSRTPLPAPVQRVLREGASVGLGNHTLLLHRDGRELAIADSAAPIRGRDGRVAGVVLVFRDQTERRRLEEQVRQAQKLESVGRLAGGVAHDFNNLLTVILSCAEALRDAPDDAAAAGDLEQILAAGWRARELTRQLLAFARRQVIAPVVLDPNEVIRGSERLFRRVLGEEVELRVELCADARPVLVDPAQLEQVLMNLVVNARDAMPSGGRLTLRTRNAGPETVQLLVQDTGVGIPEEVRAHLFEPFFTTKAQGKGTGLGLATVYGIVTQSNGTIRVESVPGEGTTFEVSFPSAQGVPVVRAATGPSEPVARTGSEVVLVVEDEPQVRAVTVRILAGAGYHVVAAGSGAEALEVVERLPAAPALVVTDVVMPGMSGRELVDGLRRRRPGLRALYLSGYSGDALARHGVLEAGVHFLAKPFTPAVLLERVRAVLDAG